MHDGYLFTLGICGTASAAGPAPALLDAMLAALPPVKRAALLGEVLPLANDGSLHDPLIEPIATDIADAELLLIVTPVLPGGRLPPRLEDLLRHAEEMYPSQMLRNKLAVIVGVEWDAQTEALDGLQRIVAFCRDVGIDVATTTLVRIDVSSDQHHPAEALAAARSAYEQASALLRAQGIAHLR